jgi:regulatory protein
VTPATADDALESAFRALRHRDRSAAELRDWLARRKVPPAARAEAIETLTRTGLLDDARFAENRARVLAERGAGDALIRYELERAGVDGDVIEEALAGIEPEQTRAATIVRRRGAGAKTSRYLRSKGFSEDSVAGAVATEQDEALG